jgi:hypothetical protein
MKESRSRDVLVRSRAIVRTVAQIGISNPNSLMLTQRASNSDGVIEEDALERLAAQLQP